MNARLTANRPWLVPGALVLATLTCVIVGAFAACALTQGGGPAAPATATGVPSVEVVVVPQVVVSPTVDGLGVALTQTAIAPLPPATAAEIEVAIQPTVPAANVGLNIPIPANCQARTDWQPYTVQPGDTVGALAIATNTAVADLVIANCLTTPDIINVGQTLYLPRQPISYTPLPATPVSGSAVPTIGFVLVEPSLVESGRYLVAPGRVTVRAQGVSNATHVAFYMAPVGTDSPPVLIGLDENMADGAFSIWNVDPLPLLANVWAVATGAGNVDVATNPILVANNG